MPGTARQGDLSTIGNYDILEKIADGGMGSVYKARHRATGELVAVKVLWPELADDAVLLKRFQQEFRAASSLRHPHLVRALDFGKEGTTPYLVMEFVDGQDLWQRIERAGRLDEAEAVRLTAQVAQGLHEAHKHGIIHRDVKPDNILLTADGRAKLADLGLLKDLETDLNLTRPHKGLGTPNFIAPEQFGDAKHAGIRCDVYALGATLYMMVTGELPFRARGVAGILRKKLGNELAPPRQLVPTLSERVDWAIRRAVRADPEQRHASCPEFVKALTGEAAAPAGKGAAAGPAKSRAAEQRVSVRYPCAAETSCSRQTSVHPEEAEARDCWQGTVHDISVRGIGLFLRRRFEPQTVLTVELPGAGPGATRSLEVRVARVKQAGRGRWFIGCAFASPLGKEELRDLL